MNVVQQAISEIGIIGLIGALIWIIRLEGLAKRNKEKIDQLMKIEKRTQEQEIRIKQRDEEMRSIKFTLDELKDRVTKVENNQVSTGETLVRIETKLDIILEKERKAQ